MNRDACLAHARIARAAGLRRGDGRRIVNALIFWAGLYLAVFAVLSIALNAPWLALWSWL